MKKTLLYLFLFLGVTPILSAQGLRNGIPNTGRTASMQGTGENPMFHLQQAEMHLQSLNFEQALMELDNAIEYNPYRADAYVSRALLKYRIGMRTEAARDIEIARRLNPFVVDLFGYNGADSQLRLLAFDQPARMEGPGMRLRYYMQELEASYSYLDQEHSILSALEVDYLEQALLLIEADRYEDALLELAELMESNPNIAIAHDLRGLVFYKMGELEAAEAAFRQALEVDPNFAIAWYNLGRVKQYREEQAEALDYFNKALALEQDLSSIYYDRAQARKAVGDREGAIEDISRVLTEAGESPVESLRYRGLTRKILGDFAGALADFNELIEENPEDPSLFNNRGNLYLLFAYYDRALADYTEAIKLNGSYAEAYYNRGIAHLLNYDYISACNDLSMSAEMGYEQAREKWGYFCAN